MNTQGGSHPNTTVDSLLNTKVGFPVNIKAGSTENTHIIR